MSDIAFHMHAQADMGALMPYIRLGLKRIDDDILIIL